MPQQKQQTLRVLLQFLNIYPIRTSLLSYLSERDIILLSSTCRSLRSLSSAMWDINTYLRPYFSSPSRFRNMMARTNALISGKSALNFLSLTRPFSTENLPLDIYINWKRPKPENRARNQRFFSTEVVVEGGTMEMVNYLIEREGYTYKGSIDELMREYGAVNTAWDSYWVVAKMLRDVNAEDMTDLYEPAKICALIRLTKADKQIRIIVTKHTPLFTILSDFHSTCMMNFISHERAYSLFPWMTFHLYKNVPFRPSSSTHPGTNINWWSAVSEYGKAGWDAFWYFHVNESDRNYPLRYHRSVGDKYTWILPLSYYDSDDDETATTVTAAGPSQINNSDRVVLETASFNLLMLEDLPDHFTTIEDKLPYIALSCQIYEHDKLKMKFIVDGIDPCYMSTREHWIDLGHMNFHGRSIKKMGIGSWRRNLRVKLRKMGSGQYDDRVLGWYREWYTTGIGAKRGDQVCNLLPQEEEEDKEQKEEKNEREERDEEAIVEWMEVLNVD